MKKVLLSSLMLATIGLSAQAPVTPPVTTAPKLSQDNAVDKAVMSAQNSLVDKLTTAPAEGSTDWHIVGQHSFMLNQASFSNWIAGGANFVGWVANVNYNATYQKDKELWENIAILGYGQTNTQGIGMRKSQDIINLSSNYGYKMMGNWYYSVGGQFLTQFTEGFTPSQVKLSNFMAPAYLNLGIGFTYKPDANFSATIRPLNARWTFVMDSDLQKAGNYGLKNNGDSSVFQLGFLAMAMYRVQLMENVTLLNNASVFSNYLDHPERLVMSYSGILNMKVNDYISTMLTLDLLYDHNQIQKLQAKQTLSVGLAYTLKHGSFPATK